MQSKREVLKRIRADVQDVAKEIAGWDVQEGIKQSFEAVNCLLLVSLSLKMYRNKEDVPLVINTLTYVWNIVKEEIQPIEAGEGKRKVLDKILTIIKTLQEV